VLNQEIDAFMTLFDDWERKKSTGSLKLHNDEEQKKVLKEKYDRDLEKQSKIGAIDRKVI